MYRYNTLRVEAEIPLEPGSIFIQAEIVMVDSNRTTLNCETIKLMLLRYPKLKSNTLENYARLLSLKVARYAFKEYPYTLTVKVKATYSEDGTSSEMELSQEDLVVEQLEK